MKNMIKIIFVAVVRSFFMLIAGMVAVTLGAYIAFFAYQAIFYVPNVTVPSVLNLDLNSAQQALHESGLKMIVLDNHLFREGVNYIVIRQNPLSGTEIKRNRSVEVEIKEARVFYQIPDLLGKTVQDAENILLEYGYQIGNIAYSVHHELPQGIIIAQTPQPGEKIQNNVKVSILLSKGLY